MIIYADSSVLARAYLADEPGHQDAAALLSDPERPVITGSWSNVEVSGALVRAARASNRAHAVDEAGLLAAWDQDTAADGPLTVLRVPQEPVETLALELVRAHGLRAMDAWHLAAAATLAGMLSEPGETMAFASRDVEQRKVATLLGFDLL
ncbi:MAG: type II toxin-antitoxin system VapC family toxin [Actinomycetota bacterium]|nr:type II toxin-antitoxin system VapC family toxin [Actinomycetota bacterium]